ncbi:MAG: L-ribulose-5-phosphate 4-epimerase AraD [Kiritimatiellia bacterium]|jgi:L-ribulose-5-phosphate 4-epimerase|nr:L-ribulose-5-phosphate 4-epimerase AraD [Kiritimatiellia bacterium]
MLDALKAIVCEANLALVRHGLVTLTWGNVSGIDRARGLMVIKPSGVPYDELTPEAMTVTDLDERVVEGRYAPSSDTPTHAVLYKAFPNVGGVVHTHSAAATAFAQAGREIPCFGTTHADHFHGAVPVVRMPTEEEVREQYERHIGLLIVEHFRGLDPDAVPGVLAAGHGPFVWGPDPLKAVENAVALEAIAQMAAATVALRPEAVPLPGYLLDKHYGRKHGPGAYYGQGTDR